MGLFLSIFFQKDSGFPAVVWGEMFTFVRNEKGKPEAMAKKFDDCVMAASIGYAILGEQEDYVDGNTNDNAFSISKAMFGEDQQNSQQIVH